VFWVMCRSVNKTEFNNKYRHSGGFLGNWAGVLCPKLFRLNFIIVKISTFKSKRFKTIWWLKQHIKTGCTTFAAHRRSMCSTIDSMTRLSGIDWGYVCDQMVLAIFVQGISTSSSYFVALARLH